METVENQEYCDALDLSFLQMKVSQLRLYKGGYFSEAFAKAIFDTYSILYEAVEEYSIPAKSINHKPELISNSMVECCILYVETTLQELVSTQHQRTRSQIFTSLFGIAHSLYDLSFCIKYSLVHQGNHADRENG